MDRLHLCLHITVHVCSEVLGLREICYLAGADRQMLQQMGRQRTVYLRVMRLLRTRMYRCLLDARAVNAVRNHARMCRTHDNPRVHVLSGNSVHMGFFDRCGTAKRGS